MSNKAKEVIIPKPHIFRTIFLYVGQGDATLLVVPNGEDFLFLLVDSNYDDSAGGIDIEKLLLDLFEDYNSHCLDVFINTHPHKDHLAKIKDIYDNVGIKQVWHSGHKPGKEHEDAYKELEYIIKELGKDNVFRLKGSSEENKLDDTEIKLGDINYNILAPAEYVSEDIADEKPEERYRRIHEQCGVIRLKYGKNEKQILIPGDSDYTAWKEHITKYHMDRLPSFVLRASHHGSNSFFWKGDPKDEAPFLDHLNAIDPTYIVVSAPKREESKHKHPDSEAMKLYEEYVGKDGLHHLGKNRECIIVDINNEGDIEVIPDDELVKHYGIKDKKDNSIPPIIHVGGVAGKIDEKPMG